MELKHQPTKSETSYQLQRLWIYMLSPLPDSKWTFATAAHLLNRAGFGGPPQAVEKLHAMGPEKAVSFLVEFDKIPDETLQPSWAQPDPGRAEKAREYRKASEQERRQLRQMEQRTERERLLQLKYWWLQRMTHGPRPLQEKLTLFWHGHFATSAQKVRDPYLMFLQNDIFRKHGAVKWLDLLSAVSKDPAMLLWLDQAQSRKQHPNENFARELMELFTLGEGNYTEKDVTEAARALTGWSYDRLEQKFVFRRGNHDNGTKTILGKSGHFDGDDVLKIIVEHPQSAEFITRKLWTFFASENPSPELVQALAKVFRAEGNQFKPLLRTLFLCEEFYSERVIRQQVKSPVQWLVSSVRMLERDLPPPAVSTNCLKILGQDLLMPPNVKGWDGGVAWITTNNLLNRYNFAEYLVLGENSAPRQLKDQTRGRRRRMRPDAPVDATKLFPEEALKDKEKLLDQLQLRFVQAKLTPKAESVLRQYLDAQGELDQEDILQSIRLIMSMPEFQLC